MSVALTTAYANAQEQDEDLGWSDQAELSFVTTAGNSETTTLGFHNTLRYGWLNAQMVIEAGGLRTETTRLTRTPMGTGPDDFDVVESGDSELTAENYYVRGRYERDLNDRWFVTGSGGWNRNEFAGIRNRYFGSAGIGTVWFDSDVAKWRTSYGVSATREKQVAGFERTFAGARLSSDYERQVTDNTTFVNTTILDENLDDTEDLRIDTLSSVAVSMTERLAIKISLQLLFDNQPSLALVPLQLPSGDPAGIDVPVEADRLDTLLNVALVISF